MSQFQFDDSIDEDEESFEFSWGGRDATIFLIDSSPNMHLTDDSDEQSPFKRAVKCAVSTLCRKIISSDQDLTGIVFYNTKKDKDSDFPHIYVLHSLDRPGAERVIELEDILNGSPQFIENKFGTSTDAALDDALWACKKLFMNCKSKISGQSIMVFSNNDNPHGSDQHKKNQIMKRVQDLKESDIELEVLHMGDDFDITKIYKELLVEDDDEDSMAAYTLSDPTNRFDELMDRVRKVNHKQRSSGKVNFTLAPGVELGVSFYTTIRKTTKPPKVKLDRNSNEQVKTMKKEYLDETGQLVMPTDFVQCQTYGGREIKFTVDECKDLKKVYPPGIQLLGFKPISSIKPYFYIKPANFIYPDDYNIQGSFKMFAALLERCLARQVAPIVRVIPRKNSSVAWAALLPQQEELDDKNCQISPPGFQVAYLPFADDFRMIDIDRRAKAKSDQIEAAMEVMKRLSFKYHPDKFENPDLQTHWRNIETLALSRSKLEPVTDYTVPDAVRINRKAQKQIAYLRSTVYSPDYDPSIPIKKPTAPAAKRPKIDPAPVTVEAAAKAGTVAKLNVDTLKTWLQERDIAVKGKKKPQLVQDVYDELGIDH